MSVAAPFLIEDLGLNAAVMGTLLSAFFWTYAFAQVPAGWLVDRFGVGRTYAAGFVLWVTSIALTGLATSLAVLFLFRLTMGIGQSVAFPASSRAVANWFPPKERGGVTGLYLSGNRLGQAAITALGGVLIAIYGWRFLFGAAGLAGVLWLVPWLVFHWRYERTPVDARVSVPGSAASTDFRTLLRDRRMAGIFLGFFAYDYVWLLFITWMPGYLMMERKFGPEEMGLYVSLPYLLTSVIALVAGIASDAVVRKGYDDVFVRKSFITAGLLIGCLIVPAGFVEDRFLSVLLIAVAIWGLSIAAPNTWVLTQAVCERDKAGVAAGIQNFGGNLGGAIAPAVTGLVAHVTGSFAPAFAISGGILLFGIAAYWLLVPGRADARVSAASAPSTVPSQP